MNFFDDEILFSQALQHGFLFEKPTSLRQRDYEPSWQSATFGGYGFTVGNMGGIFLSKPPFAGIAVHYCPQFGTQMSFTRPVRAIGFNLRAVNGKAICQHKAMRVALIDGTEQMVVGGGFIGFISDAPMIALNIQAQQTIQADRTIIVLSSFYAGEENHEI